MKKKLYPAGITTSIQANVKPTQAQFRSKELQITRYSSSRSDKTRTDLQFILDWVSSCTARDLT